MFSWYWVSDFYAEHDIKFVLGHAYLRWAFGEAAVLFLRGNPDAQAWLEKKTRKYNKAKALRILAHKLGRAVFYMLKRKTLFEQDKFLALR